MATKIEAAIGKSSKLEVDDKPAKGLSLTATLELTKDDKSKPTPHYPIEPCVRC
jgi:hypothetical protein